MSKKSRRSVPKPYKSKFEYEMHTGPFKRLSYEPTDQELQYQYVQTYKPDLYSSKGKFLVELKGRMRTYGECRKYVAVRECNPEVDLRFVLADPKVRAYPGCKMSLGDWLTKQGFKWCSQHDIPKSWTV